MEARINQEKNFRYRASFQKMGPSRFLSHLELIRQLKQAFEESGIPLSFSRSGHPQPQVSFGPALPMNVESREEFIDFFTYRFLTPREIVRYLNEVLPAEISLLQAVPISKSATALSAVIDGADYTLDFAPLSARQVLEEYAEKKGIPFDEIHLVAIRSFQAKREIPFAKHKSEKVVNIKDFVRSIRYVDFLNHVVLEMKITDGVTVGIQQVAKVLYETEMELPIRRERLYVWSNGQKRSPLTLEWEQIELQKHLMNMSA